MPLHIPTLGERVTEADIWAYVARTMTDPDSYKADLTTLEGRITAARAILLDKITKAEEDSSGTLLADGTEQELVSKESTKPFLAQLILDVANMTGADQILVTESMKVLAGGGLELFTKTRITGGQEEPILIFMSKYSVRQYRVTLQQLAGVAYREYDWSLIVEE